MPKFGFRFSIRTLLLTMIFCAMVITWITYERRRSHAEQSLAKTLQASGNEVVLGGPYDTWHWPNTLRSESWWERLAERTLGQRIRGVLLEPSERDSDLCALSALSDLTYLKVNAERFRDESAIELPPNLRFLDVSSTANFEVRKGKYE